MEKEFEIIGCVSVDRNMDYNEFYSKFIDFIEKNNWKFGGGINEIIDGYYMDSDGNRGEKILEHFDI